MLNADMNRQPTNRERNANDVIDTVGFPDIPCENRARRLSVVDLPSRIGGGHLDSQSEHLLGSPT